MLLFVLFGAAFGHLIRFAQVRRRNMWWVGAVNYVAATGLSLAWWAVESRVPLLSEAALLGVVAGLALGSAYFLLNASITLAGVGISIAVGRLSIAVPVAASVLVWHETLSPLRTIGLAMSMASFALLARSNAIKTPADPRRKALVLTAFFVVIGVVGLSVKAVVQRSPSQGQLVFLIFMFATAALILLSYAISRAARPSLGDLGHGLVLGTVNMISQFSIISALLLLDATKVFPATSVGIILISAGAGALLWGERFRRGALVGLIVGAAALVLVNI